LDGGTWQVLVVVAQDKPDGPVLEKLPAASSVAYISLEPLGAGPEGYAALETTTRHLAEVSRGVWVDPSGTVYRHDEGTF